MIDSNTLTLILESKKKTIDLLKKALQEAEEELDIYTNDIDAEFLRQKLSRWVDRVYTHCQKSMQMSYEDRKKRNVYRIPLHSDLPGDLSMEDLIEKLRTDHLIGLFGDREDARNIGNGKVPFLEMFLTQDEYQEILSTKDEDVWFFLCNILIVRNGKDQYGNRL